MIPLNTRYLQSSSSEQKSRMVGEGGGGYNGNGEFNGYRVSVLQDEKVLDLGYSYIYTFKNYLMILKMHI